MFDIKVYGVKKRLPMIEKTVEKLGLSWDDVIFDDRENGGDAYYTARKAFLSALESGAEHAIILQDDIEVCNNFKEIASEIIETHPDKIIALFPWDEYLDKMFEKYPEMVGKTPYIRNRRWVTGCGFIIPTKHIQSFIDFTDTNYRGKDYPEDSCLFTWALRKRIPILNTVPALIQHIGDSSLIYDKNVIKRTTKYFKEKSIANWKTELVMGKQ